MKKNKITKREKIDKFVESYIDKLFNKNPKISWSDVSFKAIEHGYFAEDLMSILDIHINKKGKKMKDLPIREVATFYGIYTCFKKPLEAMKCQNMEDWFKKNKIKCKSIARFKNLFSQCNSIFHIKRKGNYKVPHYF
jgi:hypothetical protein